jgi:hypothetical protein
VELERYFNFAAIWAFGGTLEASCRESFSNWWKEQFEQHIDYPEEGTVRFSWFSLLLYKFDLLHNSFYHQLSALYVATFLM